MKCPGCGKTIARNRAAHMLACLNELRLRYDCRSHGAAKKLHKIASLQHALDALEEQR